MSFLGVQLLAEQAYDTIEDPGFTGVSSGEVDGPKLAVGVEIEGAASFHIDGQFTTSVAAQFAAEQKRVLANVFRSEAGDAPTLRGTDIDSI